ncbi:bis(5'-nucleosyl)-tetraphosphatase (symmetrical) YqeK [Levilactobacillus sp. N40-8-2]|mgnify:FL=1|uniref:bis(5'-nucleosyl)-tetraphosphatase (symmetrical) YqeK n=1 Tax=Levilactobacillus muriae TaxID=3238987 RepID=UPI0038B239EF
MTELTYKENIFPGTRQELIDRIAEQLRPKRFQHVLRVEQTALELAATNGVDAEKASIGGLIHDYAKQRPDADFIAAIKTYHLDADLLNYGNAIWHGLVGAELIKRELHIYDEDVLNAVRHHTTGDVYMTPLEQVVYMADYLEPARDFPGVDEARKITSNNLGAGVAYQAQHTLQYLVENGLPVYPKSLATYNAWVPRYQK